jgi:hypothetical protein
MDSSWVNRWASWSTRAAVILDLWLYTAVVS